jgi:hypothetical protein
MNIGTCFFTNSCYNSFLLYLSLTRMTAAKRILTGLTGAIIAATSFTTGVGAASAHEWYSEHRDWRKEVICTYDYTHNDAMHYEQDGCALIYGSFSSFGHSLERAGYWTEDRTWNYAQHDTPVYHPTTYAPYTYRTYDRPYYFSNIRYVPSTIKYAPSPYSWRCVEQIARDHQLKPCI